ncbi:Non-canonical poly(A) RNA polymerase [Actinidia chinensis var. chinensis]|uniref:polynucleotide adenylyltransferase n=1 Tax=Actinidia chinensis var. chinensis TaxID=1590841 RepID=A0A2R6QBT4_ACTCC|nr:Non-canonical poly(A) RNA polymerase [Actinidia chinensis var. chinensis]
MEAEDFLYDALSPLSAAAPPTPPADSETYVVFRNEISLSTTQPHSPEAAAADYFSLDVGADNEEAPADLISTLSPALASALVTEPERTLEGGWFRANCRFKSPLLQLHKEILDFCDFLSPTPEEKASRNAAVESVFGVVRYIWPNCKVEVFGSFKTGLYLPTSDIDVVILGSDIKTPQIGLQALTRALSQRGIAKKIQVIAKARVPIIKFVEKRSGIAFDISFDVQNGPIAADFIKDAVSKWPPLRPLCLILKVFLQQRELNEVYTGGIGSYALLTMLMAMLRSLCEQEASPEHNLGVLLVKFFDIYGRKLNTSDVGVTCNGAGSFFLKSSKGFNVKGRPFLIAIEDPQAPENDIGKSSFGYFQVRSAFSMALSTLTNAKTILSLGPNRSILGTIIRPDAVLLERKGGSNGEITFNKLLPGAGEPLQANYDDQQEIYCNWQLDDEEAPLPRGNGIRNDGSTPSSSGKKRKAASEEKVAKKVKENEESGKIGHEESDSRKEKGKKKKRWRHNREGSHSNGFRGYVGGSPWGWTS